jgi:TatA/E family protein of Tat protein translocase
MGAVGPGQLLIIFAIILLLFGARKLPEVGRALGTAITEFKSSINGDEPASGDDAKPSSTDKSADQHPGA